MAHVTYLMGRFTWHAIRNAVKLAMVRGFDVELIEGPGWIEREFRVQGSSEGVRLVHSRVEQWARDTA